MNCEMLIRTQRSQHQHQHVVPHLSAPKEDSATRVKGANAQNLMATPPSERPVTEPQWPPHRPTEFAVPEARGPMPM